MSKSKLDSWKNNPKDRECSLCYCDIPHTAKAYCEGCYRELEDEIKSLKRKIERLEGEIKKLKGEK